MYWIQGNKCTRSKWQIGLTTLVRQAIGLLVGLTHGCSLLLKSTELVWKGLLDPRDRGGLFLLTLLSVVDVDPLRPCSIPIATPLLETTSWPLNECV